MKALKTSFFHRNEVSSLQTEVQLIQQRLQKIVSQRNKLRYMYKESDCPHSNQTTTIIVLYHIKLIPNNYANLVLRKLAVEA